MRTMTLVLVTAMLQAGGLHAQDSQAETTADEAPLFTSNDPISFTIRAPFETLFKDRSDDAPELPATLLYEGPDGQMVSLDLDVELRGHNRRRKRTCNFPPLRLDFPKSEMEGTLFTGQNRLKLVTQCQSGRDQYGQYVLLEYLIYRAYNVLTDVSFKVRLVNITYEDTDGKRDPITQNGFIIEDERRLAERHGWEALDVPVVSPEFYDPDQLALAEVFQYMIGHTDWSAFAPEPGSDECCHNGKVIGTLDGWVYPIPYDFDFAGLINARYAEAAEQLGTRGRVRTRVYRGICRDRDELMATLQTFNLHQQEIYTLFQEQPDLEEKQIKQALEYLDDFYETINDERDLRNKIERRCREA
ncbi:MAG: hypothetical protein IH876_10780 [Gemmatimonadetes bacterium]|nr:hypothetical protein [Gemmatimonadota bacterium]